MNLIILLMVLVPICISTKDWRKPGCHLRGYERHVEIDNCEVVPVEINACRGFCSSYAIPSDYETIQESQERRNFTSRASCCSIAATEELLVPLTCNGETRIETIMSARECKCGDCDEL